MASPDFQKLLSRDSDSENQKEWARCQEANFKDKITSIEVTATYRLLDILFTIVIATKGKHPDGKEFLFESYISFQLIDGRWYFVDPVPPKVGMGVQKKEVEK